MTLPRIALFVVALTRAAEFDNSAAFSTRAEIEALLDSVWAISNAHATAVLAGLAYNASDGVRGAADVRRLLFALQKGSARLQGLAASPGPQPQLAEAARSKVKFSGPGIGC